MRIVLLLAITLAACGGSKKPTTASGGAGSGAMKRDAPAGGEQDKQPDAEPAPIETQSDPCMGGEQP